MLRLAATNNQVKGFGRAVLAQPAPRRSQEIVPQPQITPRMSRRWRSTPLMALLAGLLAALGLVACGSSSKPTTTERSVTSSPSASATILSATTTAATTVAPATTAPAGGAGSGGTPAPRTESAPAYVHEEPSSSELAAAIAVVKAHGYTPNDTSEYHPSQTLRVLVGTRTGSGDGYGQQAFFFVGGRYIGTDAAQPSATIAVAGQSEQEVTLVYPIYRANDPLCCASGGQAKVRFALNDGKLTPLDPIPPYSERR